MMKSWDEVLKAARDCQTKAAWETLFAEYRSIIRTGNPPKLLDELFRLLSADAQSQQYDPNIWRDLLDGCIAAWNLELGRKIAEGWDGSMPTMVAIPAAKIFLESGFASMARELAQKALRRVSLLPVETLQLEMIICSSYVEEGKRSVAVKLLRRLEGFARSHPLPTREYADFLTYVARTMFLLGRYHDAIKPFSEAAERYTELGDWENAAKGYFNAAASIDNAGGRAQVDGNGFAYVERCRRLAEQHDLKGPLAHCEAFYGHNDYWRGNFAGARDHYRRALEHLPASDQSYRRLHLMSMLAFTYLRTGRFHLAKKFGERTLAIASLEQSDRFAVRYENLEAELRWQGGEVESSQALLQAACSELVGQGVHTLEELATVSRYYSQCALLGEEPTVSSIQISEGLKKNIAEWTQYQLSLAFLALSRDELADAEKTFRECLTRAKSFGDRYHTGLAHLGLVEVYLRGARPLADVESEFREFEIAAARMGDTPVKAKIQMVLAAFSYHQGEFEQCRTLLKRAAKTPGLSFEDSYVLSAWIATIEGHAFRIHSNWQKGLISTATRIYFRPVLECIDDRIFMVSSCYTVNLEKMPALADLLRYLMNKSNFKATAEEIQEQVWRQSTTLQGWKQKIRNTIMRLRDCIPYTVAPIIIHADDIAIFAEAIEIKSARSEEAPKDAIIRLLTEGPMSSVQLSNKLAISPATTKRMLKRLQETDQVTVMRFGRKIYYQSLTQHQN